MRKNQNKYDFLAIYFPLKRLFDTNYEKSHAKISVAKNVCLPIKLTLASHVFIFAHSF